MVVVLLVVRFVVILCIPAKVVVVEQTGELLSEDVFFVTVFVDKRNPLFSPARVWQEPPDPARTARNGDLVRRVAVEFGDGISGDTAGLGTGTTVPITVPTCTHIPGIPNHPDRGHQFRRKVQALFQ